MIISKSLNLKFKIILISITSLILHSCQDAPTYNPFDQEFDVSIRQVINNGCDTISAGCRYYNLAEQSSPSWMYYQVHDDEFYEVVAKGFVYHMDTFTIMKFEDYYKSNMRNSILNLEIIQSDLNRQIEEYNYTYLDRQEDKVLILNRELHDTIKLRVNLAETNIRNKYVRNVEYFIGNDDE